MSDIAKAADLSRQSIYNQFGSKESALTWAVDTSLTEVARRATSTLDASDTPPSETLLQAFYEWAGRYISMMRNTAHGLELFDFGMSAPSLTSKDYEAQFFRALENFLAANRPNALDQSAADQAFMLNHASKGLVLKSADEEAYLNGMRRVIGLLYSD